MCFTVDAIKSSMMMNPIWRFLISLGLGVCPGNRVVRAHGATIGNICVAYKKIVSLE